jgi:hypothetical protein
MEPFITTILTIGGAITTIITKEALISGVAENRADAIFCKCMQQIAQRVKGSDSKTNHDLQRAIRKAQLESIIVVCGVLLKEKGYSSEYLLETIWKKVKNTISPRDSEEIWLTKVCKDLIDELQEISKHQYVPSSTQADMQIELLLRPNNNGATERLSQLKEHLLETTLIEIRLRHPHPPHKFIDVMRYGWKDTNSDGLSVEVDWFNGLCNSFAYELKHNQTVANIFQSQLLANLAIKDEESSKTFSAISLESFSEAYNNLGGLFSTKLAQLENHITDLQKENKQIISDLGNTFNRNFNQVLLFSSMMPDLINQQVILQRLLMEEVNQIKDLIRSQGKSNEEITISVGEKTQESIKTALDDAKNSIIKAIEVKGNDENSIKYKIAILYKRNVQPDEEILYFLEEELKARGHTIFIDRHLSIGVKWANEIENQIRTADAVICLLSETAIRSEMLAYELQIAYEESQKSGGRPYLIPIRIKYEGVLPPSISCYLDQLQYALWNSSDDNSKLTANILEALSHPKKKDNKDFKLEAVGGAVPLDSKFYITRNTDEELLQAIERRDSIILIKGSRQVGKTSLLARGLRLARQNGARVILTDFQQLNSTHLETIETFYMTVGYIIAEQLDLKVFPEDIWKERRAPSMNFERYLKREVLEKISDSVVWALDEADRLFSFSYGGEVFGFFRSLHNARALDPDSPWSRLTMTIAYATEAHLFITDPNQSPFNVGTRLVMEDFTFEQIKELNRRYHEPLKSKGELSKFCSLVGGHPYLVRRGLHEIASRNLQIDFFESICTQEDGPYGDHLRRFLVMLSPNAELCVAVREVLSGHPCPNQEAFYRLRSAGLLTGDSARDAKLRCTAYENYLRRHLA